MVQRSRTLQCLDKVVDGSTAAGRGETVEIPQLQTVEKPAETPQTQTIQGSQTSERLGITLVCQVAEAGHVEVVEIGTLLRAESCSSHYSSAGCGVEASKVVSQDRVETLVLLFDEKIVEMSVTRTQEKTQQVVNTHVQMSTHTTHQQLFTPTVGWKRDGSPSHEKWWKGTRDGA